MAYVIPDFNVNVAFWRNGNSTSNPPDVITIGNLSPGRIVSGDKGDDNLGATLGQTMWLRLPKGTDVQDAKNGVGWDVCECPYTSGRFYNVIIVDDIGGGFLNEHRFAVIAGQATWPTPFPPVGGFTPIIPPSPPGFLLNFTTHDVLQTTQTYGPFTCSARIGGYIVVYDSALAPQFNTGLGNAGPIAGPTFTCSFAIGIGHTAYLYSWTYLPVAGVNNLQVSIAALGGAAWSGAVYDTFFAHGVTTSEGNATGGGTPGEPPYTPAAPHPWVHPAFVVQVAMAPPTFQAPFSGAAGGGNDTIGGTSIYYAMGCYPAGIGGVFPAQCTPEAFGNWGMLQVGWAP